MRRVSFRSVMAWAQRAVKGTCLGCWGTGCRARARCAGAHEWGARAWLALAHAKHAPGGQVSLPGQAAAVSDTRLKWWWFQNAQSKPGAGCRLAHAWQAFSMGLKAAHTRAGATRSSYAASLNLGKVMLRRSARMCSCSHMHPCVCIWPGRTICAFISAMRRFRRSNSGNEPSIWWRAVAGRVVAEGGGSRGSPCFSKSSREEKLFFRKEGALRWGFLGGVKTTEFPLNNAF